MVAQVAVNARFRGRRITGVERYAEEISRRLGITRREIAPGRSIQGIRGHLWEQMRLPTLLQRDEVLWSPANSGPVQIERQLLTIHDLSPLDHPEWFKPSFVAWYRILWKLLSRQVRAISTPSNFTRERIITGLGVAPEKVHVIYGGVSDRFRPIDRKTTRRALAEYNVQTPFVLFVGTLEPRKNLSRLLSAWTSVQETCPNLELVIVGERGAVFRQPVLSPSAAHVRWLGYAPETSLPSFYSAASAVVLLSHYEGFGLTLLEALACGAPVLASDIPSLRETMGDCALFANPNRESDIANKICQIVEDTALRDRLVRRGLARAWQFTWDKAALATSTLLKGL